MTAQVIFLNRNYYPDEEERHELDKMQEFLTFSHAQFAYELRGLNERDFKIRKESVHRRARQRIGIVKIKES